MGANGGGLLDRFMVWYWHLYKLIGVDEEKRQWESILEILGFSVYCCLDLFRELTLKI